MLKFGIGKIIYFEITLEFKCLFKIKNNFFYKFNT